ncbi:MAG TPA: nucleotidyltransferase domain-containing protein [Chitinophagaceae bacterium]
MVIQNIHELENYFKKAKIFELLGVSRIGVFGSFARNENFKDIDLLIEQDVNIESLIYFQNKIKKDIDVPVDIILSKYAEPIILYRAKQDLKYASC